MTVVNISTFFLINRAPSATQLPKYSVNAAISLLVFTAVVFRSEVALYLAPLALQLLWSKSITFLNLLKVGILSGLASIGVRCLTILGPVADVIIVALTVAIDSYFWNTRLLWPELFGVYFNVYLGKSSDWGVSFLFVFP
jgi:alpha-1,6-mannosyltransferase